MLCESSRHGWWFVARGSAAQLDGLDVANGPKQTVVVPPIDPFECREFGVFQVASWSFPADEFCF